MVIRNALLALAASSLLACGGGHEQPRVVTVRSDVAEDTVASIRRAVDTWCAVSGQTVCPEVRVGDFEPNDTPEDGEVHVVVSPDRSGIRGMDSIQAWGETYRTRTWAIVWIMSDLDPPSTDTTAVHELGHAYDLPHSTGPGASVMKGTWTDRSWSPTCADAKALCDRWACDPVCSAEGF